MNSQPASLGIFELGRRQQRSGHSRKANLLGPLARIPRGMCGCAALMIGILICARSASAGVVSEEAGTAFGNHSLIETDITVSTLQPLIVVETNLDEAYSSAVLNGPGGTATLNGHACSGGLPGFGIVNVTGGFTLRDLYQITSSTLPIGAPVFVSLVANGARRATGTFDLAPNHPFDNRDSMEISGNGSINFDVGNTPYPFAGSFNQEGSGFGLQPPSKTGLFDGQDSQELQTVVGGTLQGGVVPALVGDFITVDASATLFTHSEVGNGVGIAIDADAQLVLNWGINPLDNSVQIVNVTYPVDPVPDNSDLTLDQVLALLPPRPETVPEPGTFILLGEGLAAGLGLAWWRRCFRSRAE